MNLLKQIKSVLLNSTISTLLFCLFIQCSGLFIHAQEPFRRHYIIALDNSETFRRVYLNTRGDVQIALNDLFENRNPMCEGNVTNLWNNELNRFDIFNPEEDEISFCLFNYQNLNSNNANSKTLKEFCGIYLNENLRWTEFRSRGTVVDYINANFSNQLHSNSYFPKIIYPLVLSNLEIKNFAEEYILIVISQDYIQPISNDDLNSLNNLLHKPDNSLVENIKLHANKFYSLYSVDTYYFDVVKDGNTSSQRRIISGYKITPRNVIPG